jgi:hypothetical protein
MKSIFYALLLINLTTVFAQPVSTATPDELIDKLSTHYSRTPSGLLL